MVTSAANNLNREKFYEKVETGHIISLSFVCDPADIFASLAF